MYQNNFKWWQNAHAILPFIIFEKWQKVVLIETTSCKLHQHQRKNYYTKVTFLFTWKWKKKKLAYSRSYQHFQQQHFTSFCQKISSMQCVNDFLVFNWPWNVATDDFSKKRKNQMFFRGWPLKPRTYQLDQKWSNAINGCSKVLYGQNIL